MTRKHYVFFLFLSIFFASSASALPNLSKIPWSAIGQKIKSVTTSNNTLLPTTMALRSGNDWIAAAQLLTIPVYYYNPMLGLAASAVLGYADSAPMDAVKAFNDGKVAGQSVFKSVMDMLFPPVAPVLGTGSHIACTTAIYPTCTPGKIALLGAKYGGLGQVGPKPTADEAIALSGGTRFLSPATLYMVCLPPRNICAPGSCWIVESQNYTVSYVDGVADTGVSAVPDVMPAEKIDSYLEALKDIMNNRTAPNVPAQVAIKELLPEYTPAVPAIPAEAVTNFNNNTTINNETAGDTYNQTISDIVTNNPTSVEAKIEEAKAQEMGSASVPALAPPVLHSIDFKPITDLKGTMMSTFPFGLVSSVATALGSLVADPVAPHFTINVGSFTTVEADFSCMNLLAEFLRNLIAFFFYCVTAFYCVRLFRGM
ncbi:MAG: hypothetical protein JZU65_23900 [Chlorobium sp.]|nr:hypothetical protein [Chlorobium sp.]